MEWLSDEYGDIVPAFKRRKKFHRCKWHTFFAEIRNLNLFYRFIISFPHSSPGNIGVWGSNVQGTQNGSVGLQPIFQIIVRGNWHISNNNNILSCRKSPKNRITINSLDWRSYTLHRKIRQSIPSSFWRMYRTLIYKQF